MADAAVVVAVVAVAAITAFVIDGEDVDNYLQNKKQKKRRHRMWMRQWLRARNDSQQRNTVYKLQQELLEVRCYCY